MAPIRPSRSELRLEARSAIWTLHRRGLSIRETVEETKIPQTTVWNTLSLVRRNLANNAPNIYAVPSRSGRPLKLSARAARSLARFSLKNRRDHLLALSTPSKSGTQLCRDTTRSTLLKAGISRRKSRSKPGLTQEHKKTRWKFRRDNLQRPWALVCWSDEVHFYSDGKTGNVYVSRRLGEEFIDECTQPTHKVSGFTVSAWGCFMGPERGPLVFLDRDTKFNGLRYRDEVFLPHFLPFYLRMRDKYGLGVIL